MTACVPVTKLVRENAPSAMRLLVPAIITAFIWLKKCGTLFFVYIFKDWTTAPSTKGRHLVDTSNKQTNTVGVDRIKNAPIFAA
jgi:hypothetical protein